MSHHEESISNRDYDRLCGLIHSEAGIRLGPDKKTMLEVRLRRRLKALNIDSFASYCDYLFGRQGMKEEIVSFIDVLTTNKTDFFRESQHFDYLVRTVLPEMTAALAGRPLLVWSAGCSTGEEPYTLAIVLSEYAEKHPAFQFRILATDVSTKVLEKAAAGVYTAEIVEPVPMALKRKYFMRSRDASSNRVRVVPELRRLIEFQRLNFMDAEYAAAQPSDAIFCRNVLIYFDRPTQERILRSLCRYLMPDGYLFVGHSETLHDMKLPVRAVAPTLYRKIHG